MLAISEGSAINTAIHILILLTLTASIAIDLAEKMKNAVFYWGILFLGVAVKIASNSFVLIDLGLLLFAAKGCPFKLIARTSLVAISVSVMGIVFLSVIGILPDYIGASRGNGIRHSLGFLYTTYLSHYYFNIATLYVFIRSKGIAYLELILLFLVNVVIYALTFSRNSFMLVSALIICAFVIKVGGAKLAINKAVLSLFAEYSWFGFFTLFLMASLLYSPENTMWEKINTVFSNRFAQTQTSIFNYGLSPLGEEIEWVGNSVEVGHSETTRKDANPNGDDNFVDNSFINILLTKGWIALIYILMVWSVAGRAVASRGDAMLCAIFLLIALHSTIDPQLTSIEYSAFWFLAMPIAQKQLNGLIQAKKDELLESYNE